MPLPWPRCIFLQESMRLLEGRGIPRWLSLPTHPTPRRPKNPAPPTGFPDPGPPWQIVIQLANAKQPPPRLRYQSRVSLFPNPRVLEFKRPLLEADSLPSSSLPSPPAAHFSPAFSPALLVPAHAKARGIRQPLVACARGIASAGRWEEDRRGGFTAVRGRGRPCNPRGRRLMACGDEEPSGIVGS